MDTALAEAREAFAAGEVPVGAVVVSPSGVVLAQGRNRTRVDLDPTAHAEILVIRAACRALGTERLVDCDLYVTLEPCAMCAAAISFARIRRLYWGAADPKSGGVEHGAQVYSHATCHHRPELYPGLAERDSSELLGQFFRKLRN